MKKTISIVLIFVMLLSITLCSSAATTDTMEYFHFGFDDYIFGVPQGTICSSVKNSCIARGYLGPSVYTSNDSVVSDMTVVRTGMYVEYLNDQVIEIAVYGDVDGSGAVDVGDQMALRNIIMGSANPTTNNVYNMAGDMNYDGVINAADTVMLTSYISNGLGSAIIHETVDVAERNFDMSYIGQYLNGIQYSNSKTAPASPNDVLANLDTATVYAFGGHGLRNSITVQDGVSGQTLLASTIRNLDSGKFSQCRLALFSSCLTAEGGTNASNFSHAVYDKGARTVIGFSESIYVLLAKEWNKYFFYFCSLGHTVEEACFEANCMVEKYEEMAEPHINGLVIFGDKTQRIAQPLVAQGLIQTYSLNGDSDPMSAFESDFVKVFDEEGRKGYYDLSAFHNASSDTQTYAVPKSRATMAEEALSEYIDVEDYAYLGEGYNESLDVYTLTYSKMINGVKSTDKGTVMIKNNTVVAVITSNTGAFDTIAVPIVTTADVEEYLDSELSGETYALDGYSYDIGATGNVVISIGVMVTDGEYSWGETITMPLQ